MVQFGRFEVGYELFEDVEALEIFILAHLMKDD
jgi:hypothetical protein